MTEDFLSDVAVVIVTYAAAEFIEATLRSLPVDRLSRVIVIDNDSPDETASVIRQLDLPIHLIARDDNPGFGAGCNAGFREIGQAEWVLFLNPDATLPVRDLDLLVAFAKEDERLGLVGPRLHDSGEPLPPSGDMVSLANELHWLLPPFFGRLFPNRQHDADSEVGIVGYVEGACMLIRAEAFRQVGGFDENYFLFFEEVDLARRLHDAGWSIRICHDALAEHHVGSSRASVAYSARPTYHRSAVLFFEKWSGARTVLAYRLLGRLSWRWRVMRGALDHKGMRAMIEATGPRSLRRSP